MRRALTPGRRRARRYAALLVRGGLLPLALGRSGWVVRLASLVCLFAIAMAWEIVAHLRDGRRRVTGRILGVAPAGWQ